MYYLIAMAQPSIGEKPNIILQLAPAILIFVVLYFLLIKPQQNKQKEALKMLAGMQKGDKVITSGGIHGIIANVKDDIVTIKIAENVKIDVSKSCITTIKKSQEESV